VFSDRIRLGSRQHWTICTEAYLFKSGEQEPFSGYQALRDHLDKKRQELQRELKELKKKLRWLKIDTITGVITMSFEPPKAMVSAAALVGISALNPLVAAGGLSRLLYLRSLETNASSRPVSAILTKRYDVPYN
jgi:hypothetical protein